MILDHLEKTLRALGVNNYAIFNEPLTQEELFEKIKIVVGTDEAGTVIYEDNVSNYPFTFDQFLIKLNQIKKEYEDKEYQRLRAKEYPPVTDYLDAVVKDDLEQQQAYIDACLAVKAKYPKPEEA
jgi:L-rhamnose mutarotase